MLIDNGPGGAKKMGVVTCKHLAVIPPKKVFFFNTNVKCKETVMAIL